MFSDVGVHYIFTHRSPFYLEKGWVSIADFNTQINLRVLQNLRF
jgi:hypothetical protein